MKKRISMSMVLCLVCGSVWAQQVLSLDEAIQQVVRDIETNVKPGTKLAVLSIESDNEAFSNHAIGEITTALVRGRKLVVVSRREIDAIRKEMQFQLSGDVSDESAQSIGKMLGAQTVITGSFVRMGNNYRLRVNAISTQSAQYESSVSMTVNGRDDAISLLTGTIAPQPAPEPAKPTAAATAPPSGGGAALTTIPQISAYLATVTGRASTPAPLKAAIALGAMTNSGSGWHNLLTALNDARKFVALDLSACTMDGKIFDPRVGINAEEINAGASFIVEIILPNAATSTAASREERNTTFRYLTNLRKIEGNVTDIGHYAFVGHTRLTTVSFPKAINIGQYAFYNCGALTAVSFPCAMSIGEYAFYDCDGLTTVSFPEVMSIGKMAFHGCGGLTTASFPEADSIGLAAFNGCNRLTSVTLGTITPPNFDNTSYWGYYAFPGNLREAYYQQPEGQRAGRYTRSENSNSWSKR